MIGHAIKTFDQDSVNKIQQHQWIVGLDKTMFQSELQCMYARMIDICSSAASDCAEAESAGAKAVAQRTSFADVDES